MVEGENARQERQGKLRTGVLAAGLRSWLHDYVWLSAEATIFGSQASIMTLRHHADGSAHCAEFAGCGQPLASWLGCCWGIVTLTAHFAGAAGARDALFLQAPAS